MFAAQSRLFDYVFSALVKVTADGATVQMFPDDWSQQQANQKRKNTQYFTTFTHLSPSSGGGDSNLSPLMELLNCSKSKTRSVKLPRLVYLHQN